MKYKFIVFTGFSIWGKTADTMTKEYFIGAVQRGDYIVNLEDGTYFDKEQNAWVPVEGDK